MDEVLAEESDKEDGVRDSGSLKGQLNPSSGDEDGINWKIIPTVNANCAPHNKDM